jgi:hypothetical protein
MTSRGGTAGSGVLLVEPNCARGQRLAPWSYSTAFAVVVVVVVELVVVVVVAAHTKVNTKEATAPAPSKEANSPK